MVDMSATIIHHGHIRLLKRAKKFGYLIVGLTSDQEILKCKGYKPELTFSERSEILKSIKYVDEIVETNWLITKYHFPWKVVNEENMKICYLIQNHYGNKIENNQK